MISNILLQQSNKRLSVLIATVRCKKLVNISLIKGINQKSSRPLNLSNQKSMKKEENNLL
jgi:uncharacterized membrane protein YciS (DUF1049 family)